MKRKLSGMHIMGLFIVELVITFALWVGYVN